MPEIPHEQNEIPKTYSPYLIRRLLSYLLPYPLNLTIILLSLLIATIAEVSLPLILRSTIDKHLIRNYSRIEYSILDATKDSENSYNREAAATLISQGLKIDKGVFITPAIARKLPSTLKNRARINGWLNDNFWYVFQIESTELQNLVDSRTDLFESSNNHSYAAVRTGQLKTLPDETIALIKEKDRYNLLIGTLNYIILLVTVLIFSFILVYQSAKIAQKIMAKIRLKMLNHILRQSLNFLGQTPVGSLVSRTANDVETINEFFTNVTVSFLKDVAIIIGVLIAIFALDSSLALISVLLMAPTAILMVIFRNRIRNAFRYVRTRLSALNAYLSEHLSGMSTINLFAAEKKSMAEFNRISHNLLLAHLKQIRILSFFRPMIDMIASIVTALIIWYSSGLYEQGIVSLGLLIAYIELIQKFFQPVKDIAEKFNIMQSAMTGAERIFELMDNFDRIPDVDKPSRITQPKGEIRFRNVNFSYKSDQKVLNRFNLEIKAGTTVGVVGRTGSGKSTIANLLTRLWDIDSGEVLFDGLDIKSFSLSDLRKMIVPVQQEAFLFSGTVRDNIDLGKKLSTEEVIAIAKFAESHQFIEKLPQGYETNISEGGTNLSAGQKQLIAFTRIIVADPPTVILDEATANIDSETEQLVQASLRKLLIGRTAIIIAHRLSTIQNADKIFVLDKGKVMEEGNHQELLSNNSLYAKMYKLQLNTKNES